MKISVAEARNKLPELLKAVEKGKRVTICRRGKPIVDMVRTEMPGNNKPEFGIFKGQGLVIDPDWWKPMTDEEVDEMLGERT